MTVDKKNFFLDPVFNLNDIDYDIIGNPMFYPWSEEKQGWYKENVLQELKNNPSLWKILESNGYVVNGEINWPTYSINKFGFRAEDWSTGEKGAIYIGCSDFFGVGNHLNETATQIISNNLGVRNYNLSIPGAGLDHLYRVLKYHIADINTDYVFLLIPESTRRELYHGNHSNMLSARAFQELDFDWTDTVTSKTCLEDFYFGVLCENKNNFLHTNKALDAIKYICLENNKKLVFLKNPAFYLDSESVRIRQLAQKGLLSGDRSTACDLQHFGKVYQREIAKYFIEKL